ncbi:MAG: cupin domain-containing protein [Phycisphaerales bacterium]
MASPLVDGSSAVWLGLLEACPVVAGAIVSKPLLSRAEGRVVVFAMDAGQEIGEHRAPFMTTVQVLDGRLEFAVGSERRTMGAHDWLVMPTNAAHSLRALEASRFVLTFFRAPSGGS